MNLSELKNQIDIIEVIDQVVQLRRSGKNYVGLCPIHSEETPSFFVYPDRQRFVCFGCGKSGDVFDFVMAYNQLSFKDTLRFLGIGGQQITPKVNANIERRKHRQELLKWFRRWQNDKSDELGTIIRNSQRFLMQIRTLEDLEKYGDLFHGLDGLEYDHELLCTADKESVATYFREELKNALS